MPANDLEFLRCALTLAQRGEGHTRPNPPVGAVIVHEGKIIGRGWHHRAGRAHAEVEAIRSANRRGVSAETLGESTLYVTLEPCSKAGRVGACTDAILAAGIKKVIYAVGDPNPVNCGCAKSVLRKRGVECHKFEFASAEDEKPFLRLIAPFAKLIKTGLPYVTVKLAMSLDGRICDNDGNAKWISGEEARMETGRLRERVDAVMVGAETIRRDNPSLLSHGRENKDLRRVVITRSGNLPKDSQIFHDGHLTKVIFCNGTAKSLRRAMEIMGKQGMTHILCEGGLKLAVSLAEAGLVDEWLTVLSPCVIGTRPISEKLVFNADSCQNLAAGESILGFVKKAKTRKCSRGSSKK